MEPENGAIFVLGFHAVDPTVKDVAWAVAHRDLELAFSHSLLVERVVVTMSAYW